MEEKTNVMRLLDGKKLKYNSYFYGDGEAASAPEIAKTLGQNPDRVFKTLVTVGKSGKNYIFVVPGSKELDLKKAAEALGDKSCEMIHVKELLSIAGYMRGACTPIGMKKKYPVFFDSDILELDEVYFSAGARGLSMKIKPQDMIKYVNAKVYDLKK